MGEEFVEGVVRFNNISAIRLNEALQLKTPLAGAIEQTMKQQLELNAQATTLATKKGQDDSLASQSNPVNATALKRFFSFRDSAAGLYHNDVGDDAIELALRTYTWKGEYENLLNGLQGALIYAIPTYRATFYFLALDQAARRDLVSCPARLPDDFLRKHRLTLRKMDSLNPPSLMNSQPNKFHKLNVAHDFNDSTWQPTAMLSPFLGLCGHRAQIGATLASNLPSNEVLQDIARSMHLRGTSPHVLWLSFYDLTGAR